MTSSRESMLENAIRESLAATGHSDKAREFDIKAAREMCVAERVTLMFELSEMARQCEPDAIVHRRMKGDLFLL